MSRNSKFRRNRRRKSMLIISAIVALLAVVCVLIGIGYKRLFNNPGNIDASEIATYEYEEIITDEYGAILNGPTMDGAEVTRHKVTIIETPGAGGVATDSTYVSDSGSIELEVVSISDGYIFDGWYENGSKISGDVQYTVSGITSDRTFVAQFSTKVVNITTTAVELLSGDVGGVNGSFRPLGDKYVSKGGVYSVGDSTTITVEHLEPSSGFEFVGWRIEQSLIGEFYFVEGESLEIHVTESDDGPNKTNPFNVSKDTTIYAVYQRKTFTVTVASLPGVARLSLSKIEGEIQPTWATQTVELTQGEGGGSVTLYLSAVLPNDVVPVVEHDKNVYAYRYNFYYLSEVLEPSGDRSNIYNFYQEPSSDPIVEPPYPGDQDNKIVNYPITIDTNSDVRDRYYILEINARQAQDQGHFGAVGVPIPEKGGVITGGGSSTLSSSYQLQATPNSGYEFVRWEWSEGGNWYSSTDNPVVVKPQAFIYYRAYFEPKTYKVSLSNLTPAGSARVEGLGGYGVNTTGTAKASITIIPKDSNYIVDSVSYTMNGGNYTADVNNMGDGSYEVSVLNISGDVGLNIKMKQVGGQRITATADTDASLADTNTVSIAPYSSTNGTTNSTVASVYYDIGNSTDSITLTANSASGSGYWVKQWVDSVGHVYPNDYATAGRAKTAPFSLMVSAETITSDVTYTAQFEKESYTIEVRHDAPSEAGAEVYVYDGDTKLTDNPCVIDAGKDIKLIATTNPGYVVKYWTNSTGVKFEGEYDDATNGNALVLKNVSWSDTYIAHIVPERLSMTIIPSPQGGGSVQFNDNSPVNVETTYSDIENGSTITLKANPEDGYKFVRWETRPDEPDAVTTAYAEPNIQITNVTKNLICTAVFSESVYKIKANPSPTEAGTARINGRIGEATFSLGETAILEATANTDLGYRFEYWTDSAGNRFNDNPHEIIVDADDVYTAHFVKGSISITAIATPESGGRLMINGEAISSGDSKTVMPGANVTLKAEPQSGYKFVRWESKGESGQNPVAYADKEIQILNVTQSETYTAVFSDELYTIKVASSPLAGGKTTVSGKLNEAFYAPGDQATLQATPAAGYKFDYWTDSAGNKFTENPYVISSVTGNESFTAHYIQGNLSITVDAMPQDAGVVKLNGRIVSNGSTHEIESGSNITLTAEVTDDKKYEFERWESSKGTVSTTNPLQLVNVTESDTYTAVFNLKTGKKGIKIVSSPASGGIATKTISKDGRTAILIALPRPGYSFVEWRINGFVFSKSKECIATELSDGTVYTAVFTKTSDVDVRSDIIREHFYNEKRKVTAPVYAVTRQSLEANAKATIEEEKASQYDDIKSPKSYEAVKNAENIFSDIELVEDKSVVMLDGELITTDGEVMPLTLVNDISREEESAKEFVLKKYGERYTYEIVTCKNVGIPDGFEDGIRTYIWKNLSINSKDNIFILYEAADGKMDWVSCTIDAGDSLKFTIDSIGQGVRMTVVKVIIEE